MPASHTASQDRTFFISSQTIVWREYGSPSGRPVVYLSGTPGSRVEAAFAHQAACAHDIRLIAVDRPGLGRSSSDRRSTVIDCARQIQYLLNDNGIDDFGVVGFSAGALYAYALAFEAPNRVRFVADLAGASPIYHRDLAKYKKPPDKLPFFYHAIFSALRIATRNKSLEQIVALLRSRLTEGADREWLDDHEKALIFAESFQEGLSSPFGAAQDIRRVYRYWGFDLENIRVPVHIWLGQADTRIQRPLIDFKVNKLSRAELHMIPEIGHLHLLDHFDAIFSTTAVHDRAGLERAG